MLNKLAFWFGISLFLVGFGGLVSNCYFGIWQSPMSIPEFHQFAQSSFRAGCVSLVGVIGVNVAIVRSPCWRGC